MNKPPANAVLTPETGRKAVSTLRRTHETGLVVFHFDHQAAYLSGKPLVPLTCASLVADGKMQFLVTERAELNTEGEPVTRFQQLITETGTTPHTINQAWPLDAVHVPKPWGEEVWFTGMEDRGVCETGNSPLPWVLDAFPELTLGSHFESPLLLKILAPLPDAQKGDLYFELHEQKIEVYVVTHVDEAVWPDGVGKIRYGFNPEKVAEFEQEDDFRAAYLNQVRAYEIVRRRIDQALDHSNEVSLAWITEEQTLREAMYSFTTLRDIRVGDVIRVEPYFPHSLQHGVRVIEFQTAHFERHILSFAQKVLTQDHWDTEAAMASARLTQPQEAEHPIVTSPGHTLETIADFDAFTATRIKLEAGHTCQIPLDRYGVVIGVSGQCQVNGTLLSPEQAAFIPANLNLEAAAKEEDVILLLAEPVGSSE